MALDFRSPSFTLHFVFPGKSWCTQHPVLSSTMLSKKQAAPGIISRSSLLRLRWWTARPLVCFDLLFTSIPISSHGSPQLHIWFEEFPLNLFPQQNGTSVHTVSDRVAVGESKKMLIYCTHRWLEIIFISVWTGLFRKMLMPYNSGKFIVWLWVNSVV